jgi:hypothetical protein
MTVGILQITLNINDARSLKDKRRVVKSLKDRLRNRFNISIAEVGMQDYWQQAELAACMVGSDRRYVEGALTKIVSLFESYPPVIVVDYQIELL